MAEKFPTELKSSTNPRQKRHFENQSKAYYNQLLKTGDKRKSEK